MPSVPSGSAHVPEHDESLADGSGAVPGDPANAPLANALSALSSPVRLAILKQLCVPRALHEIRVTVTESGGEDASGRPIARQVVKRHLERLLEVGVVLTRDVRREYGWTVEYVVNHQTLFALSEAFRGLARLKPTLTPEAATLPAGGARGGGPHAEDAQGPRLVIVKGVEEGLTFRLRARGGGPREWTVGRRRGLDVCLDFDPFVSAENALVVADGDAHVVVDVADSRNGTFVNFIPLPKGGRHVLTTGDVIGVGRTLLLYRD